jgi:hypothetical protein
MARTGRLPRLARDLTQCVPRSKTHVFYDGRPLNDNNLRVAKIRGNFSSDLGRSHLGVDGLGLQVRCSTGSCPRFWPLSSDGAGRAGRTGALRRGKPHSLNANAWPCGKVSR